MTSVVHSNGEEATHIGKPAGMANLFEQLVDSGILVINCGSSSVKFALFAGEAPRQRRLLTGAMERIGIGHGRFAASADGGEMFNDEIDIPNHAVAFELLFSRIEKMDLPVLVRAVGHRVVHGGDCDCPRYITPTLEAYLHKLIPLAQLHLPNNLLGIAAVRLQRPDLPQVAAFDTAFHHGLPRLAQMTGLPRHFAAEGIRHYGFHGLSYEYILQELRAGHGEAAANRRIIVAHLGNGASMAAIRGGRSIETTMRFSSLSGLPMGTRSGDLDPGIILYPLQQRGMTVNEVQHLLYEESGLLGLSGQSRNMRDLLTNLDSASPAAEAVQFFCYSARKHLAALTAALGGLDHLIFTGGIGANAPEIRARICADLGYLGVVVDLSTNVAGARTISVPHSAVLIEVLPTDEERIIAQHVHEVLADNAVVGEA